MEANMSDHIQDHFSDELRQLEEASAASTGSSDKQSLSLPHLFSSSGNEEDDAWKNFIGLLTLCFISIIVTFFFWKKCLFEKYGAYIPIDRNIDA